MGEMKHVDAAKDAEVCSGQKTKLYKMRWLILAIFMAYTLSAGVQWVEYSIITNIVMKYYRVEKHVVEWTSMVHMIGYIVTIFPALWILENKGNRITMLVSCGGTTLAMWIKLFAVHPTPTSFIFVLIGQTTEAVSQVLVFSLAGTVTAAWFGPKEIALAGSLAFFGDQLGCGMGFVLPPLFIQDHNDEESIGRGIFNLALCITIACTIIFILTLLFFKDQPKIPPSQAQISQNELKTGSDTIAQTLKTVLSKKEIILTLFTYGIHISVFECNSVMLNRQFVVFFPGHEQDAGNIGSLVVFFGLLGSIVFGIFIDSTHLFKETNCALFLGSTICLGIFTYAMCYLQNLIMVYIIGCIWGFFMMAFFSVGLQLAIELAYPVSEGVITGLAILFLQVSGITVIPVYRYIFENYTPLAANIMMFLLLVLGTILTTRIPAYYNRQETEKKGSAMAASKKIGNTNLGFEDTTVVSNPS